MGRKLRDTATDPLGFAAGIGLVASWTLPGIFIRMIPDVPGGEIFAWRLAIAGTALMAGMLTWPGTRRDLAHALRSRRSWLASPLMAAYYGFAVLAFLNAPVLIVALLISTSPVWVLLVRALRGGRPAPREWVGVGLALVGVATCLVPPAVGEPASTSEDVMPVTWRGIAFGLAPPLASALFALVRPGLAREGVTGAAMATVTCLWGLPVLAGVVGITGRVAVLGSAWAAGNLLALGVVCTAVPTLCYAVAAGRLAPQLTSMFNVLVPICAGTAAALLLGEVPSPWAIPGAGLALTGIWLVANPREGGEDR